MDSMSLVAAPWGIVDSQCSTTETFSAHPMYGVLEPMRQGFSSAWKRPRRDNGVADAVADDQIHQINDGTCMEGFVKNPLQNSLL